jgi:putative membrane protein
MGRTRLLLIAIAAITIVTSGCSKTEGTKATSSAPPGARPGAVGSGGAGANVKSDDDFVRDVAIKNMAAIELSRVALDKAADLHVKSFAQTMIDEHGATANELKSIVSGQPIEWPAQLDDRNRKAADELAQKQGADFDRAYMKTMLEGHQDLAAKLESRLDVQSLETWKTAVAARADSNTLPDPKRAMRDVQVRPDKSDHEITMKINQWAADTYPVTQKHLDAVRALENALKNRSTN